MQGGEAIGGWEWLGQGCEAIGGRVWSHEWSDVARAWVCKEVKP